MSALDVFRGDGLALRQVEAAVVDGATAGRRPLVLDEEHQSTGLGDQRRLEVWVGIVEHRTRAVGPLADRERALEDVPDLREVVLVEGMMRTGFVAHEAGVRLGRRAGARVEEHLAPLPGPAQRLPLAFVKVDRGQRLVRRLGHLVLLFSPSYLVRSDRSARSAGARLPMGCRPAGSGASTG